MKRLLFALLLAVGTSAAVFAEEPSAMGTSQSNDAMKPAVMIKTAQETAGTMKKDAMASVEAMKPAVMIEESKMQDGKIDNVSSMEIVLSDKEGKKTIFVIKATTTIYGADAKPITIKELKTGEMAKVKYAEKYGAKIASSIYLTK